MKTTKAYFGDGVYAEYNGHNIKLTANGIGAQATDTIFLDQSVLKLLLEWPTNDYKDHNSGLTFTETNNENPE